MAERGTGAELDRLRRAAADLDGAGDDAARAAGRARGLDGPLGGDVRQSAAALAALSDAWSAGLDEAATGLHAGARLAGVTADLFDAAGNR
jgi:hypothetical protein